MSRITALFIFVLFCFSSLTGQDRFAGVEIKETKLADNIYMLEGSGGNIGLVINGQDALLIDNQYGQLSDKIMAKVVDLASGKVTKVINTHWHGDHAGGNENFGKSGALIFAHENVRDRMAMEQVRGERVTPASPATALPVVTYRDNMQLYFMGEPIMVMHVHNAHTDGDSFVFLPESNVLHMGDCFFHKRFPYIDVGSGGSIDGMIAAAEAALMLVDEGTQIIPGHGPMATKEDLQKYHEFLTTVKERIESYVNVGRDRDSMDPDKIVAGFDEWAWAFIDAERFTDIVVESLSKGN